jgi:hypothetical protein
MTSSSEQPPYEMMDAYILTKEDWLKLREHLTIGCTNQKAFLDTLRPSPAPAQNLRTAFIEEDNAFKDSIIEQQKLHIETLNSKMAEMMQGAARQAREDVLDKVIAWKRKHGYWFTVNRISGEKRYHFEPDRFEEFIKEIRTAALQSEQEQPR